MPMNTNLPRWLFASIAKYLKDTCDTASLPTIVEGVDDRSDVYMKATDRGEIRITGPLFDEFPGEVRATLPTNILITSRYDHQKNAYAAEPAVGAIVAAMQSGLGVYKFGGGQDDDPDDQIGCLRTKGKIGVYHLGQVAENRKLRQILIDTQFVGEFTN